MSLRLDSPRLGMLGLGLLVAACASGPVAGGTGDPKGSSPCPDCSGAGPGVDASSTPSVAPADASVSAATETDGSSTKSNSNGGGDAAGAPTGTAANGPAVLSVTCPVTPSDVVPLNVTLANSRGGDVTLTVSVSLDDGATWTPAKMQSAVVALSAPPEGSIHVLGWDSLHDIGFHTPRGARIRIIPADSRGPGATYTFTTPSIDNLRAASKHVQSYVINYGDWDPTSIAFAKKHNLVIVHPTNSNLDRQFIANMQNGIDPNDPSDDVIVMCYVSIGEDVRSINVTDADALVDPRFRGDGTGPRVDPRGPSGAGGSLAGIALQGSPSAGGRGWASFYLDDNSVYLSPTQVGDGLPDRNSLFGGFFVNAGDPNWFPIVNGNLLDSTDGAAGLREVLTPDYGRGMNCDGVFLDTIDTAEPDNYTDGNSLNLSQFEWTAPGMASLIQHIHTAYPTRLLLQNRGLFFFDPRKPQFQFTTRGSIDFGFFESYRLDSNQIDPSIYPDNRYNVAPKLMAEANRPDGFTVLSLGYAEGTQLPGATDTLLGKGTVGLDSFIEDIRVAQEVAGFRHYLTNGDVDLVNSFVHDHSHWDDHTPPLWTSTYNDNDHDWPGIPAESTPRVGIREVVPGAGSLTVRWDVALDENRVSYALYYQTQPFDFTAAAPLAAATRVVLTPSIPANYAAYGPSVGVFANQATITNLQSSATYYLMIRAFDASPSANEDTNVVVLTGTPAGAGSDAGTDASMGPGSNDGGGDLAGTPPGPLYGASDAAVPAVVTATPAMTSAFAFIRDKMRNPNYGVRTNYVDVSTTDLYLLGWNVTAEHMGLTLWASAALGDRQTFEQSFQFVTTQLQSPRWGIIDYAYFDKTNQPFTSLDDQGVAYNVNAPLDDMRVARGLIAGWTIWHDDRYKQAALRIGSGLVTTSISAPRDFPMYPGGLVGPGCYYREDQPTISTTVYKIPVNYADLWTMTWFAKVDPRWNPVVATSIKMMEDAQINDPIDPGGNGQFRNVFLQDGYVFDGGWEYRDPPMGQKILAIQSLWTAIHLARVGRTAAPQRALDFYKKFYSANGRIPHFLNKNGTFPTEPQFSQDPVPANASAADAAVWGSFGGAIQNGEARVYALLVDLAYLLGDNAFADKIISEKILTDQQLDPTSPFFGYIGLSTSGDSDADGYNTLESILALSFQQHSTAMTSEQLP